MHRDVRSHQQFRIILKMRLLETFQSMRWFFFSPVLHLFMLGAAEVESGWKFKEYESSYHRAAKNPAMDEWFLTSEPFVGICGKRG